VGGGGADWLGGRRLSSPPAYWRAAECWGASTHWVNEEMRREVAHIFFFFFLKVKYIIEKKYIYIYIKGKNTKLVLVVYLIYNLLPVVSKRTQKSLWYVKKTI
jgi:hypothetical protein